VNFAQVYGAAILCGIGFTMSLFIGMLAFENTASDQVIVTDQLGILAGTLLSAVVGSLVLYWVLPRSRGS
jgi:NhaA family Na+:H+ antiporter